MHLPRKLVREVDKATGIRQADVKAIGPALLEAISESLARGESVLIPDFGRFTLVKYPPRLIVGFDGKTVQLPAQQHARFQPSPTLTEKVRRTDTSAA